MKNTGTTRAKETPVKMMSVQEFAKSNGISVMSVYRMLKHGEIQGAVKLGSQWRIPTHAVITNSFDASAIEDAVLMSMPQQIMLGGVLYVRADTEAIPR